MIWISTLRAGVFIVPLFLLSIAPRFVHAQTVPCDNSQALSVIPTNGKGKSLMPKDIDNWEQLKKDARLQQWEDIAYCLEHSKPLINHIIDFDLYVTAWKNLKNPRVALHIQKSLIWSSKGGVSFAKFGSGNGGTNEKIEISVQIQWNNVTLGPSFSAEDVKFPPRTSIMVSRFPHRTSFGGATFGERASFKHATFGEEADFEHATFGERVSFESATFGERASFKSATFGEGASFRGATFGGRAYFSFATFGAGASFRGTTFSERAYFGGTTFSERIYFRDTTLAGGLLLGHYVRREGFLRERYVWRKSFLLARYVRREGFLRGHYVRRGAYFRDTTFSGGVSFESATFGEGVSFGYTSFDGDMSLRGAVVRGRLVLSGIHWAGRADFRESVITSLSWDSGSRPSRVIGVFDARGATFEQAIIKDVSFSDLVDFSDTNFGKREHVTFENVIFEKEVDFLRATFWDDAIFVQNRFRDALDFTGVVFPEKEEQSSLYLSFNRINKLFMEKTLLGSAEEFFPRLLWPSSLKRSRIRSLETYSSAPLVSQSSEDNESSQTKNESLSAIYNTISLAFREANDRQGENEAWYLGQVADRQQHPLLTYLGCWLLFDFPSRYGIDISRVVLVSFLPWFVFASIIYIYFRSQANGNNLTVILSPFPPQQRAFRFRPVEPFFQNQSDQKTRPVSPCKDALFLSGRAFFKLGLGTAYPHSRTLKWIACIAWVFGMYMLIHFLFVVKNTLPIALPFLTGSG